MIAQTTIFDPRGVPNPARYARLLPFPATVSGRSRPDGATGVPDPRPIVQIIHPDAGVSRRLADLCASIGIATQCFADIPAFVEASPCGTPGCLIVHLPLVATREIDLFVQFRSQDERPPMIVTADRADVRTAVQAMKAGAVDVFEEPLRDQDILDAVDAAIEADRTQRHVQSRRAEIATRFATLTTREREVMALVTQGRLNKQVAGDLGLSEVTVKVHRGSAMRKMGARTLADLVRMADVVTARTGPVPTVALREVR